MLSNTRVFLHLQHLETNDWVQQLFLDKNMISDTGIAAFAGAMARNAKGKISKIDLLDNDIGNGGAIALADMLKVQAADEQRTVLRQLNLRQNKIGNKGVASASYSFNLHPCWNVHVFNFGEKKT